jgi:hypothetical protein
MAWILYVALLFGFVVAWNRWRVVTERMAVPWAIPGMLAALALAYTVPTEFMYVRIVAVVMGMSLAAKSLELSHGSYDQTMLEAPGWFLLWLVTPPDARRPRTRAEAASNRAVGRYRLCRGIAKGIVVWALIVLGERCPALHDQVLVESLWALWLIYAAVSGIVDLLSGVVMQLGLALEECFDAPFLARSPRNLWSRRWNRIVHRWLLTYAFRPLGGRRRPLRTTVAVFLVSGLLHEYLVVACLGRLGQYTGWMTAFFILQGAAVVLESALRKPLRHFALPTSLTTLLHLAWMTATAPLFVTPLAELFRAG